MAPTPWRGDPIVAVGVNPREAANHQPAMDPDQGSSNVSESLLLVDPVRVGLAELRSLSSTGFTRGYRLSAPPGPQPFLPVHNSTATVMTRTAIVGQWDLGYNKFRHSLIVYSEVKTGRHQVIV